MRGPCRKRSYVRTDGQRQDTLFRGANAGSLSHVHGLLLGLDQRLRCALKGKEKKGTVMLVVIAGSRSEAGSEHSLRDPVISKDVSRRCPPGLRGVVPARARCGGAARRADTASGLTVSWRAPLPSSTSPTPSPARPSHWPRSGSLGRHCGAYRRLARTSQRLNQMPTAGGC